MIADIQGGLLWIAPQSKKEMKQIKRWVIENNGKILVSPNKGDPMPVMFENIKIVPYNIL